MTAIFLRDWIRIYSMRSTMHLPKASRSAQSWRSAPTLATVRTMLGVSLLLMAYGGDENRETGRLMTSTFISTGVIVWGMKEIIGRKRPLGEVRSVIRRFRRGTPPTLSPAQRFLERGIPSSVFRSTSARAWSGSPGSIWAGTTPPM